MDKKIKLEFSHLMPCDSGFLYKWHTMPNAFDRLLPHWENVFAKKHPHTLKSNIPIELVVKQGPLELQWILKHSDIIPGKQFADEQVKGPFSFWKHTHLMQDINSNNSLLIEHIEYQVPLFQNLAHKLFFKDKLKRLFDYRFKVMSNDIRSHYKYKEMERMKILITGSNGLVGSALCDFLSSGGHKVTRLVRGNSKDSGQITWLAPNNEDDPHYLDPKDLEGFDAVIHLAGENIANKRWTEKQKEKISNSRILPTKLLAETLASLDNPPKVFICASAIGFYGDRGDELVDESSTSSKDFLGQTCAEWEQATKAAQDKGVRVVNTRFGIILDPKAGALAKILPIFNLGGGGNLGNGKQWMSWIALDDVLGALLHCLMNDHIFGPVNFVAPEPVRNSDFTKILAKVIKRPALFPAPGLALRLVLGEMADALLLSSTKVQAKKLLETKYEFSFSGLESALRHMLGK